MRVLPLLREPVLSFQVDLRTVARETLGQRAPDSLSPLPAEGPSAQALGAGFLPMLREMSQGPHSGPVCVLCRRLQQTSPELSMAGSSHGALRSVPRIEGPPLRPCRGPAWPCLLCHLLRLTPIFSAGGSGGNERVGAAVPAASLFCLRPGGCRSCVATVVPATPRVCCVAHPRAGPAHREHAVDMFKSGTGLSKSAPQTSRGDPVPQILLGCCWILWGPVFKHKRVIHSRTSGPSGHLPP